MQVVNVEYMSKFFTFHPVIIVMVLFSIPICAITTILALEAGKNIMASILFGVIVVDLIIIGVNAYKTDRIYYKEVIFTDDEIPTSLLEEYEITKGRGDIYKLTPIDNETPEE